MAFAIRAFFHCEKVRGTWLYRTKKVNTQRHPQRNQRVREEGDGVLILLTPEAKSAMGDGCLSFLLQQDDRLLDRVNVSPSTHESGADVSRLLNDSNAIINRDKMDHIKKAPKTAILVSQLSLDHHDLSILSTNPLQTLPSPLNHYLQRTKMSSKPIQTPPQNLQFLLHDQTPTRVHIIITTTRTPARCFQRLKPRIIVPKSWYWYWGGLGCEGFACSTGIVMRGACAVEWWLETGLMDTAQTSISLLRIHGEGAAA
ncbi:hypothetical protein LTS10_004695 [Elasticomyces elasticus]|nr:hypothetical protein LTS10_004695 [Elasticomyces elasticus]